MTATSRASTGVPQPARCYRELRPAGFARSKPTWSADAYRSTARARRHWHERKTCCHPHSQREGCQKGALLFTQLGPGPGNRGLGVLAQKIDEATDRRRTRWLLSTTTAPFAAWPSTSSSTATGSAPTRPSRPDMHTDPPPAPACGPGKRLSPPGYCACRRTTPASSDCTVKPEDARTSVAPRILISSVLRRRRRSL